MKPIIKDYEFKCLFAIITSSEFDNKLKYRICELIINLHLDKDPHQRKRYPVFTKTLK